jgi:hypothetical protein
MKMKNMRPVDTIPGMEGERIKKNDGGVTPTMIYCKNFCKCHTHSQYNNNTIKKRSSRK